MNEQLKEMYIKVLSDSGNMRWNIEDAEKFAELIVKICADRCYHMERDSGPITADLIKIRILSLIGE